MCTKPLKLVHSGHISDITFLNTVADQSTMADVFSNGSGHFWEDCGCAL